MDGRGRTRDRDRDREFKFEVVEHIGLLGVSPTGWRKEINKVSWNGGPAKFDIREWEEDHNHMSKGITMHKDEIKVLAKILSELQL